MDTRLWGCLERLVNDFFFDCELFMSSIKKQRESYSIISLIFVISLLITLTAIALIGTFWNKTVKTTNTYYINAIHTYYIDSSKRYVKSIIDNLVKQMDRDRKQLIANVKRDVKFDSKISRFFIEIFDAYFGNLSKNKAKLLMERFLTHLTFTSASKSYYIFDTKGHCVVNPFEVGTESKNLINLRDFKGNFIIKDIIKAAKTKGNAFLNQFWPSNWYNLKPESINKLGITFVRYNREFKWIFVTRIDPSVLTEKLKEKWIKTLSLYRYGKNNHGYIFVFRLFDIKGGKCLLKQIVNPNTPETIGKCLSDNTTDAENNRFGKDYLRKLQQYGYLFLKYYYKEPGSDKQKEKISYLRLYKPWNWIIGTGIYTEDILPLMYSAEKRAREQAVSIIKIVGLVAATAAILTILFYMFLLKILQKRVDMVLKDLEESLQKATYIDESRHKIKEAKRIAKDFNNSIKRFKLYEEEFLESFVNLMEARDVYTKGHSQRVALYAKNIAMELNLDEKTRDSIYRAGLLHDIGKIGIPDNVLLKPGKLTESEYHIMKYHPVFSYEILKNLEHFKYLADCVKSHHEKCDGSGYPDRLTCNQIPLCSKILIIADIFDALTTTRPYRQAFGVDEAIEILKKEEIDQEILGKVEKKLAESFIRENSVEVKFMPKEIDVLRNNIFSLDYMTGLKHRTLFLENIQDLIDDDKKFVFVRINIKKISEINYIFSTRAGDEIITYTAKALLNMGKKLKVCNTKLMSRAYADIFYMAHILPKDVNADKAKEMINFAKKELFEEFFEIFSSSRFCKLKDMDGKTITEYIDFHLTYAIYPDDAKTINELIYLTEKKD